MSSEGLFVVKQGEWEWLVDDFIEISYRFQLS